MVDLELTRVPGHRRLYQLEGVSRGGVVRWEGRELELRPASAWRER